MKQELSILIPVYNTVCTDIVRNLARQCEQIREECRQFSYEIIVADDASTDITCIEQNRYINNFPYHRFIEKEQNTGSAATRNLLARTSQYEWLLFLDSDMLIDNDTFIACYLNDSHTEDVVNGGIRIGTCSDGQSNLRYLYEKRNEPLHDTIHRTQRPYHCFRSTNFLIRRSAMLVCPFDERFQKSGYEDVLFGKHLKQKGISVCHIDNPTVMVDFENNNDYMNKIDRSLQTLHHFRSDLKGYSPLLTFANGIHLNVIRSAIRLWHRIFSSLERHNLCGNSPSLTVFKLYKIGYYLTLTKND